MPDIEYGEQLDWEVELAAVIGKRCRNVSKEDALKYVAGYTVANDVSSRHWQKNAGAKQWIKGKSFDTFCPLGPCLVTPEEIPDPQALRVITRVNGQVQPPSLSLLPIRPRYASRYTLYTPSRHPLDTIQTPSDIGIFMYDRAQCIWQVPCIT